MADEKDKPENQTKVEESAEEEGLLSLDALDAAIQEEDPEFAQGLATIGPIEGLHGDLGNGFDLEYTLSDEEALWKHSGGWRSLLYKTFPPVARFSFILRKQRIRFQEFLIRFRAGLKGAGPSLWKWLKGRLAQSKKSFAAGMTTFKYLSLQKKLGLVGVALLFGLGGFVIYRTLTKGLFAPPEELFIGSLGEWAQKSYAYEPDREVESFYDSTHSSQNMVVLPKMVVNLRRSPGSGSNPMGAFEFFVEGSAADVVVEVKDREAEVQDLFQRNIEEMSYDKVASAEGKELLCEKLRKEINKILTKGKVRRIFLKTVIIKP